MKLLTVDDSGIQRRVISGIVESLGYDSDQAANGQEALEMVLRAPAEYLLILLDWNMPVMDGLTFLKEKQQLSAISDIPVIMVTTEGERRNMIEAVRHGASAYVTKPFTPEALSKKILQCIARHCSTAQT